MSGEGTLVNANQENTGGGEKGDAGAGNPPKTAKQLEKEAKKLAKLEKFKQKQEKLASVEVKDKAQVRQNRD